MAVVFFSANGSPWRQAVVAISEYTRICAAEREFGAARGFIPSDDPILATDSVDEDGGTLIRIDHALLPSWYGIQEGPMDQGPNGWTFEATEISIILKYNDLPAFSMGGPFTPGQIVKRAFDSLTDDQRGGIRPGTFVEGPPLIADYETEGTQFTSVLTDLAELSGQEWEIIEGASGHLELNWIAPRGVMYEPVLVEGWDLAGVHRIPDTSTLTRRVRAVNTTTGMVGEAYAPELAGNRLAQTVTITSDQTSIQALERAAQIHLDLRSFKNVRYRFGVRGHWTRTTTTVTAPGMGTGVTTAYPLMGGGFNLMGGGFILYGGGSESSGEPFDLPSSYLTWGAPAWTIRPGDYLRAICPSVGKTGKTILARVMRISYGDNYVEPLFECQEIVPVDAAQLAVRSYRGQRQLAQVQSATRILASVG